jgi:hypothetical protein
LNTIFASEPGANMSAPGSTFFQADNLSLPAILWKYFVGVGSHRDVPKPRAATVGAILRLENHGENGARF